MKFIMTGHRGLIGSFLLERLKEQGHTPVLLIDRRDGDNILDLDEFKIREKVDVFIHLASFCKINRCVENPEIPFENNVLGTHRVLEFCRKNHIPKVVFASSSRILSPEKNPYTASKIFGEELVKGYQQCYGIDYIIIRPSTVYGPFNDETKRLIDVWILNLLTGKDLKIFGDENKTLDFTYIDDFIDGFILAMGQKNREFDISYGAGVKLVDVANHLIKLNGSGKIEFCSPETAQPQEVELDISAMKEIGYAPKIDVFHGVEKTYDWYKTNVDKIVEERR